ncbi:MAG: hypothetical protein E7C95_03615, partial [Anaerococcus prevotii]|uniref:hypothetical protein n=1 Tax=Anaerococcus prevotii TaxID=33034 RepID=UPI002904AD36
VACGLRSKDLHLAKPRLRSAISSPCSLWPEPLVIRGVVRRDKGWKIVGIYNLGHISVKKIIKP